MKKTLTVLLVLAIAMGAVFADYTNKTLQLTTARPEKTYYGFASTALSATDTIAAYEADLVTIPGNAYTKKGVNLVSTEQSIGYVYGATNLKAGITLTLTSTQFANDDAGLTTHIGYSMNYGGAQPYTAGSASPATVMSIDGQVKGFRAATAQELKVTLVSADIDAAAVGNYTSTVTLTCTANT